MSNLMHKVKDAIIGHHSNASSSQGHPCANPSAEDYNSGSAGRYESGNGSYGSHSGSDRYSPGDYERRTDTYGSGAGGGNYGMGSTGSGDYGYGVSEPGERATQGVGGAEGGSSYNPRREDTGSYVYSSTNRLDSGKMGSHMMGPDTVRFAGAQRHQW
ncbi:hypothetical protein BO78DRAFT_341681 [Aspergillus sclerotiicarbonarius CBS 121057]|uniref:Uncharacterized protein n=1 Tax=Aspergillus sclerotiicarbonarius (strain CBS 121057 / IBT 28362) TaxID=1448318 RepID=A0A319ETD3_ASPSB|nr:hypothetical protein BO78DRAFT_341681 [Aspergillus sclerotiicarbonarius CBS 121057]